MKKLIPSALLLACLPVSPASGQEAGRMLFEAGIVGGSSIACPGHYVGIEGRVAGPVAAFAMVENYQCTEVPETSSRFGASLRLGPAGWWARPAVRGGLNYGDDGDASSILGASLTFGQRYGARFIVDRWVLSTGEALVLLQIGGYVSF